MGRAQIIYFLIILANSIVTCSTASAEAPSKILTTVDGQKLYSKLCAKCHGGSGYPPAEIQGLFEEIPLSLRDTMKSNEPANGGVGAIEEASARMGLHYTNRLTTEQLRAITEFLTK